MPPPAFVGRYQVVDTVRDDETGVVYLARDPTLQRLALLSIYESASAEELRRIFEPVRRLAHPNIALLFDIGDHEGRGYVVTEFVKGESLRRIIERASTVPLATRVDYIIDLCIGLEYAHRTGCIHGDLTPASVIIGRDGELKIVGFGIRRGQRVQDADAETVIHRPQYLAPERLASNPPAVASDIFAVGAIFYELVTSRSPFGEGNLLEIVSRIIEGRMTPIRDHSPWLDSSIVAIIETALAKDPRRRFRDVATMRRQLARARARIQAGEEAASPPTTVIESRERDEILRRLGDEKLEEQEVLRKKHEEARRRAEEEAHRNEEERAARRDATRVMKPASPRPASPPQSYGEPMWSRDMPVGSSSPGPLTTLAGVLGGIARLPSVAGGWLRKRWRGKQTSSEVEAAPGPEPVLLGASAPREVAPGDLFTARFVAYIEAREADVEKRLRETAPAGMTTLLGVSPSKGGCWQNGTPVTVRASGEHLSIREAVQSFEWNGREQILSFPVTVSTVTPPRRTVLSFDVFIASVPVALVSLDLTIAQTVTDRSAAHAVAHAPETAFASYASPDRALVALCLSALHRHDPGLQVFMDCLDLRPNAEWQQELARIIPKQDMFLLFWSANAMKSPWVQWELATVQATRGLGVVRPMPLDDPENAPPPKALAHLNFRDRYLTARKGALAARDHDR